MISKDPHDYSMELGPMGPIGEGQSLLVRVNRNCPWNRCLFCPVYKGTSFSSRSPEEIMDDINAARRTCELLESTSWHMGLYGRFSPEVVQEAVRSYPEVYGQYPEHCSVEQIMALNTLRNVTNWHYHGARRVFLQDADALAMNPAKLSVVMRYLKESFPTVDIITCYARSQTCHRRSLQDFADLKASGLTMCLVGIETGSDKLLKYMQKGVSESEHVDAGYKLAACGIEMAAFVMPGLGGRHEEFSDHITRTTEVLNTISPAEVRVRSLAIVEKSPLYERWKSGGFPAPTEEQMIDEIGYLVEQLGFDCELETLQMTNTLFSFRGSLSLHRDALIERIAWFKAMPEHERAKVLLQRCTDEGYLNFVSSWRKYDGTIERLVEEAKRSIEQASPDALAKTNKALFAIKSKGIP
jgi:radical SAM superfamily enzyme YgiQ (UPF0313 family)